MSAQKRFASIIAALICSSTTCVFSGDAEVAARSPNLAVCNTWAVEPDFGPGSEEVWVLNPIRDAVDVAGAESQGYTVKRYFDRAEDDADLGLLTRETWNKLGNSGILAMNLHGTNHGDKIEAVIGTDEQVIRDWANGTRGIRVVSFVENGVTYWSALVTVSWLRSNWKAQLDSNQAIVFVGACRSKKEANVLLNIGGRLRFGYKTDVVAIQIKNDGNLLFNRMNGTLPDGDPGSLRIARDAWAAGGYTMMAAGNSPRKMPNFHYVGKLDTTLCPSVRNPADENVKPLGPRAGRNGTGWVRFDTHVDSAIDPKTVLTFRTMSATKKDGTPAAAKIKLHNVRWNLKQDPYIIQFDYSSPSCVANFQVEATVHADKLLANSGHQQLDGGTTAQEGVAPNADDFTWTFSH